MQIEDKKNKLGLFTSRGCCRYEG